MKINKVANTNCDDDLILFWFIVNYSWWYKIQKPRKAREVIPKLQFNLYITKPWTQSLPRTSWQTYRTNIGRPSLAHQRIHTWNNNIPTNIKGYETYRSSRSEVFLGKGILKIYRKFTGEHPCRSVISVPFCKNTSGELFLDIRYFFHKTQIACLEVEDLRIYTFPALLKCFLFFFYFHRHLAELFLHKDK